MPDWLTYTTIGFAVLFVILMTVLIVKKEIQLGEIVIGWPPSIKFVPKRGRAEVSLQDKIATKDKAKATDITFESKAPGINISAEGESEISKVKKTLK